MQGDTIILEFKHTDSTIKSERETTGEFRFKWDDAAQWFSIEQVVY